MRVKGDGKVIKVQADLKMVGFSFQCGDKGRGWGQVRSAVCPGRVPAP